MADEQETIAALPELETPAIGTEATTPETTDDTGLEDQATGETEGEGEEEELDELDFAFKKYQVPKSLKTAVEDLRADATRKTQDASARQKALEAKEAEIEERSKVSDAEIELKADLKSLDKTLEAYSKLTQADWDHHFANDYVAADRAWRQFHMLKEQRGEVAKNLETKAKERTEFAQSDLTKRVQETLEHAKKSIPGFKPDTTIPQLLEFVQGLGVPEEVIKRNWSPTFVDLAYFARIGKMAVEKQRTAPKQAAQTPAEPTKTVNARTPPPPPGLSDRLSAEEWVKRREAQLAKRA